jgi:outer membrane biosynthesis protein TonB
MSKRLNPTMPFALLLLLGSVSAAAGAMRTAPAPFRLGVARAANAGSSEREQDGLAGPVRRVKTETAKISVKAGKPVEGERQVLETTTYDQKGNRVDNAYFLAAGGSLTGKEVYKYDERGNIVEMTLHNDDGTLLAKEVYTYEFDAVGNWVKMTTSVAVMEAGKVSFEPSEVTYRSISYYLDQTMLAKMSQPASAPQAIPAANAANPQPQPVRADPAANAAAQQAQVKPPTANPPASAPSSSTPAKSAPAARPTAAPLVVASLDKGALPAPNIPASAGSVQMLAGPAVKTEGEAPAAPPVHSGPLKPISGGVLNGKAISLPAPAYPEMAKRARATGVVEVEVVIDINGKVVSAKAVRGLAIL